MYVFVCVDAICPSQQFFQSCQDIILSSLVEPVLSRGYISVSLNTCRVPLVSLKLVTLWSHVCVCLYLAMVSLPHGAMGWSMIVAFSNHIHLLL